MTTPVYVTRYAPLLLDSAEGLASIASQLAREPVPATRVAVLSSPAWLTARLEAALAASLQGSRERARQELDAVLARGLLLLEETERRLGALSPAATAEEDGARYLGSWLEPARRALDGTRSTHGPSATLEQVVYGAGERFTVALLARLLARRGLPTLDVDAADWVVMAAEPGPARISREHTRARVAELRVQWEGRTGLHAGGFGRSHDARTPLRVPGGADETAAVLAALLGTPLTLWTDVPGVMTADPAYVADARPVPHLSYTEALELAHLGMTTLHPRALAMLRDADVPSRVQHLAHPEEPGTLIDSHGSRDGSLPTCVVSLEDLALLSLESGAVESARYVGPRALQALEAEGLTAWMAAQSPPGHAVAIVLPRTQVPRAEEVLRRTLAAELERGELEPPRLRAPVTQVALVAEAMGQGVNVAGRLFHPIGALGINVRAVAQAATARSLSFVVDGPDTSLAVRTVHAAFHIAHEEVSLLVLGHGTVGSHLLEQIRAQQETLAREHGVQLHLVGLADSRRVLFSPGGIPPKQWRERIESVPIGASPPVVRALLEPLRRLPVPVLVDCTAAEDMESLYLEAFQRGIHVVAANKKPLTGSLETWERLRGTARHHHRAHHYETTVGAGLPVIQTLKDLVRTGDCVHRVEGSFSGTLGYLCDELMRGVPLSRAVRIARERGFTEPHPREDLAGTDAARKALILAREMGLPLSLEDVVVEPFVPQAMLEERDVERFLASLEGLDATFTQRLQGLRAEGKTLRYLARIDPRAEDGAVLRVGPMPVGPEHPATRLRGSEAFVAFSTERYADFPLLVQGAGAGGAVTAAGVLADILKIAQSLRGR
ncbi:amino acid kinase family protein [Citreicoccus inhibens]|uniref:amino acid kinase family protein n=1 Tax=Citreicoccus inhibens TaxID=2849499 RepID=UPI001F2D8D55|nr:bifunctional aspartate kinase/homoserine dehydrogenase I [Citreicoccus inhibens]